MSHELNELILVFPFKHSIKNIKLLKKIKKLNI